NLFDVLELFSGSFLANLSKKGSKMSKSSFRNFMLFSSPFWSCSPAVLFERFEAVHW
ncbi:17291_t:CDS:1, partial [Dentiscutata heterogama]